MDQVLAIVLVVGVVALSPFLAWMVQGVKSRRGGVASSFMDGFADGLQPQQHRLQDAKREKKKGAPESGDPPTVE